MARKTGSHSDITGPKVRDAAMRLFTKHGYAGVSMRQIAAEVGVQAGALYLYTPNKQSLLFTLLLEQMRGAVEGLGRTDLSGPPEIQIEAFVRAHFQYHMGGVQGIFIPYTELRNLTPANYKRLEEMRRIYERELEKIIHAGAETGAFEVADSKLSTLVVISILNGVLAWYRPGGRVPLADVEDHYVAVIKKALSAAC
ncbi:MAG: TetR/AcrR family transcriptional regulator [Pseudomonadota bacterium]